MVIGPYITVVGRTIGDGIKLEIGKSYPDGSGFAAQVDIVNIMLIIILYDIRPAYEKPSRAAKFLLKFCAIIEISFKKF